MEKVLPTLSLFILSLFLLAQNIYSASNLEIASDSGFSNQTLNFSAGQTIYVKISADNPGSSKHVLNLRDNQYSLLAGYDLASSGGNQFSTNFQAPSNEGYYSLEAQIESNGSKSTSVKTIKVGSPQNANVKVNVSSKVEGQNVAVSQNNSNQAVAKSSPKPSPSPSPSPSLDQTGITDYTFSQNQNNSSLFSAITQFIKRIWFSLWPFK